MVKAYLHQLHHQLHLLYLLRHQFHPQLRQVSHLVYLRLLVLQLAHQPQLVLVLVRLYLLRCRLLSLQVLVHLFRHLSLRVNLFHRPTLLLRVTLSHQVTHLVNQVHSVLQSVRQLVLHYRPLSARLLVRQLVRLLVQVYLHQLARLYHHLKVTLSHQVSLQVYLPQYLPLKALNFV